MSSIKPTIYLFREAAVTPAHCVKSPSSRVDFDFEGRPAAIFYKQTPSITPKWASFCAAVAGAEIDLSSRFAAAVLVLEVDNRLFGFCFGMGRSLIDESMIERRFGLKIVLNSVDRNQIRAVDHHEFEGVVSNSSTQLAALADINQFGMDFTRDILRSIAGVSRIPELGKSIIGRDGITVSREIERAELNDFCRVLRSTYESDHYKSNGFEWVDNYRPVREPHLKKELATKLEEALAASDFGKMAFYPPQVINLEMIDGFRIGRSKETVQDFRINDIKIARRAPSLTIDRLKTTKLKLIVNNQETQHLTFNCFECLVFETIHNDSVYVLTSGEWLEVPSNYANQVRNYMRSHIEECNTINFPDFVKSTHKDEEGYNEAIVASNPDSILMDKRQIFYGGSRSSVELCDVLTPNGELVHVKIGSRSSKLSHLVTQAKVSSISLLRDSEFRRAAQALCGASLPGMFPDAGISTRDKTVVFVIATDKPGGLEDALPFLAVQSIVNAHKQLVSMGYNVRTKKVGYFEV